MNTVWKTLQEHWHALVVPVIIFAIVMACGLFVRRHLFRALTRWASKSVGKFDDTLVRALYGPFLVWVAMLAIHLAAQSSVMPERYAAILAKVLLSLWIVSLTVVAARMAGAMTRIYSTHVSEALPVTTLTQNLATVSAVIIGTLILLNTLGISITPVLTALGVGGLAVALALQDTLSNLFAGFYVSLARQVRVGDYLKLDSGEEGYVTDISWRSTAIRALANNMIVVPNAKLAQAIVTNYHLPEKRMSLSIPIGVSYESDPDAIERILTEEAMRGAGEIPGLLAEPKPFVRFIPGFGDSSLNFTLICQVAEFVDQYLVQHELRKRIFKRFRKEGIEIPFPIRTVYIKQSE